MIEGTKKEPTEDRTVGKNVKGEIGPRRNITPEGRKGRLGTTEERGRGAQRGKRTKTRKEESRTFRGFHGKTLTNKKAKNSSGEPSPAQQGKQEGRRAGSENACTLNEKPPRRECFPRGICRFGASEKTG